MFDLENLTSLTSLKELKSRAISAKFWTRLMMKHSEISDLNLLTERSRLCYWFENH